MKMLRGVLKYFLSLKGGSESSRYTEGGGGGYKLFKDLVQQEPGVFTPTIVNRIEGFETVENSNITHYLC